MTDWKRWLPTSKMSGVFLAGTVYAFAVTVVYQVYEVVLSPVDVAWNMLWFVFLAGYGATEHRPSPWLERQVLNKHQIWDRGT